MKSYSGGVRHDYKDSGLGPSAIDHRGLSWFAVGLLLPVVAIMLFLVSEPNESMVPPPGSVDEPQPAAVVGPLFADEADYSETGPVDATEVSASQTAVAPPGEQLEPIPSSVTGAPEMVTRLEPGRALVMAPPVGERIALPLPKLSDLIPEPSELLTAADKERSALLERGELLTLTVKNGDSLDSLFRRNDLSIGDLTQMVQLPDAKDYLVTIRPGDKIQVVRQDSEVLALTRPIDELRELWIQRSASGFTSEIVDLEVEVRTVGAHGVIESSLWNAAVDAGISAQVTRDMAVEIFRWDIDFILEVRTGDSFSVVYEELWRDGEKLRDGEIIAAEFVNQGNVYRAARYVDASGDVDYYTPDGLNVRKAFMRNPIPIVRVSSGFNPNRRHPILNTIRAHRGVDYAAPTGTEVYAAADGKVASRGVNGGYGNAVALEHGGNITTLYAHLSKFGRFGPGARVKQGDVIGYVGSTGQATGPHLHYEYRVAGVHRNPQTVDLPPADPIASEYSEDFKLVSARLWRQLDLYQGTQLAALTD